jgi:hypothetical protein
MNTEYAALAARIRQVLQDVERVVSRAEFLLNQAQQKQDDSYLDGVALNLHGFYGGIERILEDIARSVDGFAPSGPEWHKDLLLQMADKMNAIRVPVIRLETRQCLDEYRGFRHLVRNVYTFNLRPSRLRELTLELRACYEMTQRDLTSFIAFIEGLGDMD